MIDPIRVEGDVVYILDQRALPFSQEELACRCADDVVAAIKSLAIRGAPAIGIAGIYGLWVQACQLRGSITFWESLATARERLKMARPTAVNLAWAIDRAWSRLDLARPELAEGTLYREAELLAQEETLRNRLIAEYGADLLNPGSQVLTHCNTGSLATVGVGTALGVIREGYRCSRVQLVWVDETRPLLQGARLTAWELLNDMIPAILIADSTAATLMGQGRVDAVIVGADRICANGDTANKVGTYGLAVLAHHHQVPFYVAAPISTVDVSLSHGSAIPIEERDGEEVRTLFGAPIAPSGIAVFNPAFDVTPGELITAIITDQGVVFPPYDASLPALADTERKRT